MQNGLQDFITQSRQHNIPDDQIVVSLRNAGWVEDQIQHAVYGIDVPEAPLPIPTYQQVQGQVPTQTANAVKPATPSISALEAALQHIMLWLFTGISTNAFSIVAFVVFGQGKPTETVSKTLTTFLIVELVAFAFFAVPYFYYLKRFNKTGELRTGHAWSIITIVLHTVGSVGSLIGLILTIIYGDGSTKVVLSLSFASILALNAATVASYVAANFLKGSTPVRKLLVNMLPFAFLLLIAIFSIFVVTDGDNGAADWQRREELASAVTAIADYAQENDKLPTQLSQTGVSAPSVAYNNLSSSTYSVCATFDDKGNSSQYEEYDVGDTKFSSDTYVSEYYFYNPKVGVNCFKFKNEALLRQTGSGNGTGTLQYDGTTLN